MTTAKLWQTLRERWWWLIAGALVGALLAALLLVLLPRTYETQSRILVGARAATASDAIPAEGDQDLQTYVDQRMDTYVQLADSDQVVQEIATATGSSARQVRKAITFSVPPETTVILVSAQGPTATAATERAQASVDALSRRIDATSGTDVQVGATVIEQAQAPERPISPDRLVVLPAGVIGGVMIALVLALLLAQRNRSPRHLSDAADAAEAPVLGVLDPGRTALFAEAEREGDPTTAVGLAGGLRRRCPAGHPVLFPVGGPDAEALAAEVPDLAVLEDPDDLAALSERDGVVLAVGPGALLDDIARAAHQVRSRGAVLTGLVLVPGR